MMYTENSVRAESVSKSIPVVEGLYFTKVPESVLTGCLGSANSTCCLINISPVR